MKFFRLITKVLVILLLINIVTSRADDSYFAGEPFKPLPLEHGLNPKEVELGRKLFHDPALSKDRSISCASCHSLNTGGVDRQKYSVGVDGKMGNINTPTVFNSGLNFRQFWDGRAKSLEEQVEGPLTNPIEMGSSWEQVLIRLRGVASYVTAFREVYRSGITREKVAQALATFERSLITPNSKFDRYLRGEVKLSLKEEKGYRLFVSHGCVACHQGQGLGGNMFQVFGVMNNYFEDEKKITKSDLGRFNVTGDVEDKHLFKVPSLRNVEVTAPYFHDGSAETLDEAVRVMGYYQLGVELSDEEVDAIVNFLKSLTGQYRGAKLK